MNDKIDTLTKEEYPKLIEVWEASVKATHHFLNKGDIDFFKPLLLNTYFDAVELRCIRLEDKSIIGFCGTSGDKLEMLFVHPDFFRKHVGRTLLAYAINELNITKVDVNEDNKQALAFYESFGFEIYKRSALDSSGKPYPILYMRLK